MFLRPTTFVIGAGASAELNLPLGTALRNEIGNATRFRFEFRTQKSGSPELLGLLHNLHRDQDLVNEYLRAANDLSDTIRTFPSVDEALHYHAQNPKIVEMGKLTIAFSIFRAERNSHLPKDRPDQPGNSDGVLKSWLTDFFSMAMSTAQRHQLEGLFKNITFVNFNYDRVLEHYLHYTLQKHAGLPADEATDLISTLTIIRPYGSVGALPWQERAGINFGSEDFRSDVPIAAGKIRTYTEQDSAASFHKEIRSAIGSAELILFLGSGYHRQNMQLLEEPDGGRRPDVRVFATTYGIHEENRSNIINSIVQTVRCRRPEQVRPLPMTSKELLSNLRIAIMDVAS